MINELYKNYIFVITNTISNNNFINFIMLN